MLAAIRRLGTLSLSLLEADSLSSLSYQTLRQKQGNRNFEHEEMLTKHGGPWLGSIWATVFRRWLRLLDALRTGWPQGSAALLIVRINADMTQGNLGKEVETTTRV